MRVVVRHEYSTERRKEHNELFRAMWTEKVRKNPEELINYIPELFPDDPNNNNN